MDNCLDKWQFEQMGTVLTGWMDVWMDGWTEDRWREDWMHGLLDGWVDGVITGWIVGKTDGEWAVWRNTWVEYVKAD